MVSEKRKGSSQRVKDGLYKRGNSWYVRCMINGKLYRKSIGPEKARAEAVLAELKKQRSISRVTSEMSGLETIFKKKERKRFHEMWDLYLAEKPELKPSTLRGYQEIYKNYLGPVFGQSYVDHISEADIAAFRAELSKKVSKVRTNNILGPLRYVLKFCLRRKLISENPALNVPPLEEDDPTIDPLTQEELATAISVMKPHQKALFTCLAWTGARPNELFALKWENVDFEKREIRIERGRVRKDERSPKTKSSKRTIPMFSVVQEALLEQRKQPTQHVDGYVFLTKHGQPYSKHVDREWRTALKKANVRHRPAYQLRHTFASLCLQNGLQPTWVAKVLGHKTPLITFKHYGRFIDDGSNFNEKRMEEVLAKSSCASQDKASQLS